ncbi:hypothetical protein J437_LFUL005316 [Ladona fulva]|uniref:TRAF3-interacting protein 1 C-terminal domain-containing protein n=1 Tax=Ladona fulva TaxID=123851 RepID=A0A8K0JY32_LADFU|nr:hypothetical protein J437_LFUL005316 [Ladona fulva]
MRKRRKGAGDTETLRALVQSIARSAHPLGSLLGMMQGNVEAMKSEAQKWRNESEKLMKQLREEEKNMEQELEPLRSMLSEVEQRVVEEREALSAAKVRVLNAEQRIRLMLDPQGSGISQVASSYRV